MKLIFLALLLCLVGTSVFSEPATNSAPVTSAAAPSPAVPAVTPIPSGTPEGPRVAVAESAAPPTWAQDLLLAATKLPIVGPLVAKALLYLGILSSILTVAVGSLLAIVNTLLGVANLASLVKFASVLSAFRDGKVMYWLRFFSLFNAKKSEDGPK